MAESAEVVKAAIAFLKRAKDASQKQREREKAALRFQVPAEQWDDAARAARGPTTVDGVQIPGRPMLSIPKLNQPVQLLLNQEKAAHLGVKVSPLNEDADDETAETIQDLYRREEQRGNAGLARSWAFDRCVKAGWGCYRIDTDWDEESNNPFDQRLVWRRVLHQDAVYWDPAAQEPDWSDGDEALVASWMSARKYKRQYKDSQLASYSEGELASLVEEAPDWVQIREDGQDTAYLVAEYFRKEYVSKTWVVLDDGSFSYADEIPEGRTLHPDPAVSKQRPVQVPRVVWSKINAVEELETQELNCTYIPLIPVVGVELQPFDAERRWQGVIEPAMDGQKMFNYAASNAIELAALEPKTKIVMYEGQEEGHEQQWLQANVRNFPYLLVKPTSLDGRTALPLPQTLQTDTSKLAMSMALLDRADQFMQAATTTIDQTRIEQMGRRRVAHQTIEALQEQSDAGNSHYLHNLQTITLPYEAKVVLDYLARIYDRPGRVARLLNGEDTERSVMLNAPFTVDPTTKRPTRVCAPNAQGQMMPLECGDPRVPTEAKAYDLRKGRYGVSVTIGKSWRDRLEQGEAEIGQILGANPQLMPIVGPTYFKFRDFPGSKEIADLLKKMRAHQYPFLEAQEGGAPNAEQLQAQLQPLQQQVQMLTQQLQQAGQIIQTEQVKQQASIETARTKAQADVELKRIEADLKVKLEEMRNATQIAVASIAAQAKGVQIDQEAYHEAVSLRHQQVHETAQAAADRSAAWDLQEAAAQRADAQAAVQPTASPNGDEPV